MDQQITEGKAIISVPKTEKISKAMPAFYNPVMKLNRDISVLVLKAWSKNQLNIALPLAGTGVRAIRFLKELPKSKIRSIAVNDANPTAIKYIRANLKKNKIKRKISISNKDASQFLLENSAMDYIDIDPFGTPNPFLDSAVKRITNEGILAVTATDTAPLCGTYPEACLRKYWAVSKRSPIMHETGLRILIRKVQLIGAQYQKALVPLYAYAKEHYFRAFFSCKKSKAECQRLLQQHGMLNDIGPLWKGALWDSDFAKKVTEKADKKDKETSKFTETIVEESSIQAVGFYDIHHLCKEYKFPQIPKREAIIGKIRKKGYKASPTHFTGEGIRSDIPLKELLKLF